MNLSSNPPINIRIGFSPCPNDTFIFDALIHNKIDTEGLHFIPVIEDVETLNNKAFQADLDVTKLSFHAFAYAIEHYEILDAGSALGEGCGPLLITSKKYLNRINNIEWEKLLADFRVAIPGRFTTANLLLKMFYPRIKEIISMPFNSIETSILKSEVDAGVIIHENRFTYEEKGLIKISDLGEEFEIQSKQPIPLGGITVRRTLSRDIKNRVNRAIRRSVEFALLNPKSSRSYVKKYSQELSDEVINQHIRLYVNKFSVELGEQGKNAILFLLTKGRDQNILPASSLNPFLD